MQRTFGYARVSTTDQNLDTQLEQLRAAGCDRIFQEKISGATTSRPQLDQLLASVRAGDTVMVARLNRLGRSAVHLMHLVQDLRAQGVRFVALDAGIDSETPAGKFMVGVFALLAEYDREGILERTAHGRALAKAKGTHMGRPAGINPEQLAKVKTAMAANLSVAETVRLTGISESTVKRYRRALSAPSA